MRAFAVMIAAVSFASLAVAQEPSQPPVSVQRNDKEPALPGSATLLKVPVTKLIPGDAKLGLPLGNPVAGDPDAVQRGMQSFLAFNCVGCHAPNGGGGMGPSLSNSTYIYGGDPANIYLSIAQGRPNGMPSWGSTLPPSSIWDLVAYVQSLAKHDTESWGKTISADTMTMEQVPAEYSQTATPWDHTQAFSHGQKPNSVK